MRLDAPMTNTSASLFRCTVPVAFGAAILLAACAHHVDRPDVPLAEARASTRQAEGDGALASAPVELQSARDKLNRAEAAARADDFESARALAEEARVDADLADHKTRAAKAQLAANELARSNETLRRELERKTRP
jgi:hypothetical protein